VREGAAPTEPDDPFAQLLNDSMRQLAPAKN
jgi:hypothetical protein